MGKGKPSDIPRDRANWDEAQDIAFTDAMVKQAIASNVTKNGFTKQAWGAILNEFKEKTDCNYDVDQLRNRMNILKARYKIAKDMRDNASGFGWESTTGAFTAPKTVWAEYLKAHPGADFFKKSAFPVFDQMSIICDGKIAEGKFAKSRQHRIEGTIHVEIAEDRHESTVRDESVHLHDDQVHEEAESIQSRGGSANKETSSSKKTSTKVVRKRKGSNIGELSQAVFDLASAHRFRASYFKSVDDPFGLNKCIDGMEALDGIQENEIFEGIKLFKEPHAREAFLSLKPHRRLNWLRSVI
ncbi:hypothetical protein ACHQM5_005652 [Ranunculus cassubicifolius]